ncbi:MAG: hypothetical protein OZ926_03665 [Pseudomonas sp.]|jgi:hypothetical protein|uniref:hypothetical protein n=1 Tax=Stutzerimonas stutzeri group TaxID=136846 RepID=UPI0010FF7EFF|nr:MULTISPECIES: hypothetical protein [Stutzerimonas stutzeri group]MDA0423704.1 hypothetical protein [Stutzerimonas frequens]MEB2325936.1 hypothetical protein [Pseudomonas sp.]QCT96993.1 hypothetical protein FEV13_08865 [Stutzerimonas degradans]
MTEHSLHSSYREKLIEHLLIGELLKLSWKIKDFSLEISKPEVDNSGYDIIAEANGVIRHIQLKATFIGSATATQKIHVSLAKKPSGCVVLVHFNNETLELGPYYFFGAAPGQPLPSLENLKIAKHTKGNASGLKTERPNIRTIKKGSFMKFQTINELYSQLFVASS